MCLSAAREIDVPKEQDTSAHAGTTPRIPSSPASSPTSSGNRDNKCVIAGTPDPFGAQILAFTSTAEPKMQLLLTMLLFWGGSKKDWSKTLNLWWKQARFALKPLKKDDDNLITVQFHWLKRSGLTQTQEVSGQDVLAQAGLHGSASLSWGTPLHAHRMSGFPLLTSQTFVIRAEDKSDLPSFELLQLQWDLHRVAATCEAANVTDDEICRLFDSDDDEPAPYNSDEEDYYYMDSERVPRRRLKT